MQSTTRQEMIRAADELNRLRAEYKRARSPKRRADIQADIELFTAAHRALARLYLIERRSGQK